jgi:hypothetical protein
VTWTQIWFQFWGSLCTLPALPCWGGQPAPRVWPGGGGGWYWAFRGADPGSPSCLCIGGDIGEAPGPFSMVGGDGRTWDTGCKIDGCDGRGGPWNGAADGGPGGPWPGGVRPEPVQKRPGDLKVTFVNFDSYKQMTDTCFSDMKQEADLQIFFFFFGHKLKSSLRKW